MASVLDVGGPAIEETDPRRHQYPHLVLSLVAPEPGDALDPGHVGRRLHPACGDDQDVALGVLTIRRGDRPFGPLPNRDQH
ncbi:MAG: hypothetical protein ACLGG5_08970 [Thermoleophilia bacterium]